MKTFFRIAAIFDWIAALGLLFTLDLQIKILGIPTPNYPGAFTLIAGFAIIMGFVYWKLASEPRNRTLFQVALLGKLVPFLAAIKAYALDGMPVPLFVILVLTDGVWIPIFWYFYGKEQKLSDCAASTER